MISLHTQMSSLFAVWEKERVVNKNYHWWIRIGCTFVLLFALYFVLSQRGIVPKFWEKTTPVSTTLESEDSGKTSEVIQQPEPETDTQEAQEPQPEDTEPEKTGAQILEEYLADDPRTPVEAKGIYVSGPIAGTVNTFGELEELVNTTELNAMVIDVKNDAGEVTYKMGYPLSEEIGAELRYVGDMKALVERLKSEGIYVIARIVAFKDPILAEKKPEYAVKNADGTVFHDNHGLAWVKPYNEAVWDYLIDISKKAVEIGFDEIQYDYIRFSTAQGISEADFGEDAIGKTKQDVINGFLTRAYETLAPMGVFVSVDVFGTIITSKSDGELIGQDYAQMAQHCDYICPMVYPSHYANGAYGLDVPDANPHDLIYHAISDGEKRLQGTAVTLGAVNSTAAVTSQAAQTTQTAIEEANGHIAKQRPWFQAFTATWVDGHIPYQGRELRAQITGSEDAGVGEWLLWNASNNYENIADGLH